MYRRKKPFILIPFGFLKKFMNELKTVKKKVEAFKIVLLKK